MACSILSHSRLTSPRSSSFPTQAYDVLQKMQAAGVYPNAYTYTTLIKGAANAGNSTSMMDIFHNMIAQVSDVSRKPGRRLI